jgi:hypothetical protein
MDLATVGTFLIIGSLMIAFVDLFRETYEAARSVGGSARGLHVTLVVPRFYNEVAIRPSDHGFFFIRFVNRGVTSNILLTLCKT